ncbi:MAG: type I-E CRISPR-associated protein Cas5/CasD [Gammaproteobacteria bacterium]|nr:type I-E CRISPR-associated protein Cas5/CasD [Gammaproteobacteria bacterium]
MTDYLILKLQGPMQSWGGHTYEDYRPTEAFPTRSGVIGLLAACIGIDRSDKKRLLDLADSIEMAVRQDERAITGSRLTDFHTVEAARKVDGSANKNPVVSRREYLCDVSFTVAIRSSLNGIFSLDDIEGAVKKPFYTPFLGRRACPVSRPLYETRVQADSFINSLQLTEPGKGLIYSDVNENSDGQLQMRDVPLDRHRQFATRRVFIHSNKGDDYVSE